MMLTEKQNEVAALLEEVYAKARTDEAFKSHLMTSPKEAIYAATGKNLEIPENSRIVVQDQSAEDVIYLNIPRKLVLDEVELSEEQLEAISGGVAPLVVYGVIFLAGVAVAGIKEATR